MRVNEIYREFRDKADFYVVYIQEIHPTDGWQVPANVRDEVLYAQPTTADERAELAGVCMLDLKFEMPLLLDGMDNDTDTKYAALPEHLYLIDAEGTIAYRSEIGPWGFDPEAWRAAIAAAVGT